jgi:hypothetical protein
MLLSAKLSGPGLVARDGKTIRKTFPILTEAQVWRQEAQVSLREKAMSSRAHAVIVDLEDGVAPGAKESARRNVAQLLSEPLTSPCSARDRAALRRAERQGEGRACIEADRRRDRIVTSREGRPSRFSIRTCA